MPLTHYQIANAKPGLKTYKLRDSETLYLAVKPNGAKLWRMNYRYLDRQKTLHFGPWPAVGIADARARRDAARKQLAAGLDPASEKKVARITRTIAAANSFKAVADEWVEKNVREGRAEITLDKIRWLLGMADPMIGARPIAEISPQEVLDGIATARTDRDVAADLKGALITPKVTHLAAITTPKEAGALLRAIDGYTGHGITAMALKLSPHLFVRPGELRKAEWTEVDARSAVWSLSAEKMKMRRPHRRRTRRRSWLPR